VKLSKWILSVALSAGVSGIASATPITWTDTISFDPDRYIAPNSPASYTHDIRDDGYRPLIDSVVGYSLNVNLYDDADQQLDVAMLDVPGLLGDKVFFDLSGEEYGGWSLAGFAQLAITGLYDVTVSSKQGDFYLGSSTFTVRGDTARSVPEPDSLTLLALVVLAAGATSLWKSKRQLAQGSRR
jgi:hypothetical protein